MKYQISTLQCTIKTDLSRIMKDIVRIFLNNIYAQNMWMEVEMMGQKEYCNVINKMSHKSVESNLLRNVNVDHEWSLDEYHQHLALIHISHSKTYSMVNTLIIVTMIIVNSWHKVNYAFHILLSTTYVETENWFFCRSTWCIL